MKQLIIIIGTIILGIMVFNMMVGNDDNSLKSVSQYVMEKTIAYYNEAGNVI